MNRNFRILIAVGLLGGGTLAAGTVNAATVTCRAYNLLGVPVGEPLVVATTGEVEGIGSVVIDGTYYSTRYEIVGLDRVWLWGGPNGVERYALRVHPDGSGAYFKLSAVADADIAPAAQRYICEQL